MNGCPYNWSKFTHANMYLEKEELQLPTKCESCTLKWLAVCSCVPAVTFVRSLAHKVPITPWHYFWPQDSLTCEGGCCVCVSVLLSSRMYQIPQISSKLYDYRSVYPAVKFSFPPSWLSLLVQNLYDVSLLEGQLSPVSCTEIVASLGRTKVLQVSPCQRKWYEHFSCWPNQKSPRRKLGLPSLYSGQSRLWERWTNSSVKQG